MSTFSLDGSPRVLLHHLALYGLAEILEEAGVPELTLRWSRQPEICAPHLDTQMVEDAVRAHAANHVQPDSWISQDTEIDGTCRGLMSPRLSSFKSDQTWEAVQAQRHEILDRLIRAHGWHDLRFIAALGEPCYWSKNLRGDRLQDDGASRFEMQPRNRGSEVVRNRLRPLAKVLVDRRPGTIAAGLTGQAPMDELGGGPASVSATGLSVPGPADNAVVWCALWGISDLPIAAKVNAPTSTSGHLGKSRAEWFYVPVWSTPWRSARLRTVLAARQLRTAASAGLVSAEVGAAEERASGTWLRSRGVDGVIRFPVGRFGSDNAPERRALGGQPVRIGGYQ